MDDKTKKLIDLLKKKQAEIAELEKNLDENKVYQWKNEVLMILDKLITEEAKYYKQFNSFDFSTNVFGSDPDSNEQNRQEACREDLQKANVHINSIIYGVENELL